MAYEDLRSFTAWKIEEFNIIQKNAETLKNERNQLQEKNVSLTSDLAGSEKERLAQEA